MRSLRDLSPAARLLVVNQVGVNLGFYMVLPYLATYLADDLGLAAATIGLVLGLRTLSQQGLFLPSGAVVDRFGPRTSIVAGCALRAVAFVMLGLGRDPVTVVAAVGLVGVAGALFNPAVRAYLALEAPERRAETFAVFEVCGNVGTFAGPLLGAVLVALDFQLACYGAAVVFAVLTLAQLAVLPRRRAPGPPQPMVDGLLRVVGDRRLAALVLAASAYLALFNQLYLVLPIEARRVTGRAEAVGALFLLSSVLGILVQVRVTRWCRARWSAAVSAASGLMLMAAAFVPVALSAAVVQTADSAAWGEAVVRATPLLVGTILLALGLAAVTPFVVVLLADAVGDALIGTAYGWFYFVAAVATTLVAWGSGALLDVPGVAGRTSAAVLLVAVGATGAAGMFAVQRRGVAASRMTT